MLMRLQKPLPLLKLITLLNWDRGTKITIFKMKRRKGYRRKQGHRQSFTEVRVDKIED